jgi:protein O-mannosyl-transferase
MSKKKFKKTSIPLQPLSEEERKQRLFVFLTLISILALAIITFSNSVHNGFISSWDDNSYVTDNIDIRDLTFSKALGFFKLNSFYNSNYHPLTILSYAIEANAFGTQSAIPFHTTNLILHLLNICLVFCLIYLITAKLNISAIVAALFALHPMHVESVSWISERKDVLYTFFYIASIIFYLKYLKGKSGHRYLIFSILLFVFSCLSKSMAVSLPVILLLCDYVYSRRFSKTLILEKIPYLLIALLFGLLAIKSQNPATYTSIASQFNHIDRIFIVSYNAVYYIVKLFCPISLSAIHYYPIKSGGMLPFIYYLAPAAILLILGGVYWTKKFRKELIFGLLFYAITLSLVLQIIPVGDSVVSERYSYVPYIGLFYILGVLFNGLAEKRFAFDTDRLYLFSKILVAAYVLLFAVLSVRQNNVWENGISLFSNVIERYPEQSHGYLARGAAKANANDLVGALEDFSRAINHDAGNAEAYSNRAAAENILNRYEDSIRDCEAAIKIKPDYADAYNNYGMALSGQGKFPESLRYFYKAVELNPKLYAALNNIGMSKSLLSNNEEAITYCNKAIAINPYYPDAYLFRGNIKQELNDFEGAITDYTTVIKLDPARPGAYRNRGLSYFSLKDYAKAADDLNRTVALDSSSADDFYDLGVAYHNLSQPGAACESWSIALSKGHPQAEAVMNQFCR